MPDLRLPIARDLIIDAFTGGTITSMSSYMENCMVDKYSSDGGERLVVTQRPAIDMIEDASVTVADARGRAMYYWDTNTANYFINNNKVYKSSYNTVVGTISAGTKKCYFYEVGTRLVVVDPENNEVWTITTGDTLAQVTDPQLPSTIAGGGVVLDGYLFLIDDIGVISNCDLDDATAWTATNFTEAERKPDSGVTLARHHDHIVAMGRGSIEFFYDAGNPVGSVLNRRSDIFYNVGCPYEDGVWEDGDSVYFVGRTERGDYGIYVIEAFQLRMISTTEFNSFLTANYAQGSFFPLLAGFAARGHTFLAITLHTTPSDILPVYTFVYDVSTSLWGLWSSTLSELSTITGFPVAAWTESTASVFGSGILTNGDLMTLKANFSPEDTNDAEFYIIDEDDYVVADYIATFGAGSGSAISMVCRIGHIDGNTNKNKFGTTLEIVADYTTASQTLTVKWSDTDHTTFTSTRTIDLSSRNKLSRIGKYNRRTYQLEYAGTEIIRLEALEYNQRAGSS